MDIQQARRIAERWVHANVQLPDDEAVIDDANTIEKDFGWIFFYNSRRFLEDGRFLDQLAGNAPIIVRRDSPDVLVTGTAKSVDEYVDEYRKEGRL